MSNCRCCFNEFGSMMPMQTLRGIERARHGHGGAIRIDV
jgi:hypothetical protein